MPHLNDVPAQPPMTFPGRFSDEKYGKPFEIVWIYSDVPGDNRFELRRRWQTKAKGVAGRFVRGQSYNIFDSKAQRDKTDLESTLREADCVKGTADMPVGGQARPWLDGGGTAQTTRNQAMAALAID